MVPPKKRKFAGQAPSRTGPQQDPHPYEGIGPIRHPFIAVSILELGFQVPISSLSKHVNMF